MEFLNNKKKTINEESAEVESIKKQIQDLKRHITNLNLAQQGMGGGGAVNIKDMDDVDRSTALVNGKFLKYNSATGKFIGADAVGADVDEAAILDNSGTPELAVGITAEEVRTLIGAGTSSFDGAYGSLSGTPTIPSAPAIEDNSGTPALATGITAAEVRTAIGAGTSSFDGAYGSLTGTPTIPTAPAIEDNSGTPELASGITAAEVRTAIGAGTSSFDGAYGSLTGTPTIPTAPAIEDNSGTPELASGITAAEVRTAIGAGTSSFDGAYNSLSGKPTIPSALTDLGISDGTDGQVLETDGSGNFSFTTISAGAAPLSLIVLVHQLWPLVLRPLK